MSLLHWIPPDLPVDLPGFDGCFDVPFLAFTRADPETRVFEKKVVFGRTRKCKGIDGRLRLGGPGMAFAKRTRLGGGKGKLC